MLRSTQGAAPGTMHQTGCLKTRPCCPLSQGISQRWLLQRCEVWAVTEQCPGPTAAWFCTLPGAILKLPLIYLYPVEERWSLAKSPLSAVKGGQKAFKETSLMLNHSQLFCMRRQKKHRCCEGYKELPLQGLPENPSVLGLYRLEAEKRSLPHIIWGVWVRGRQSSCRDSSSLTSALTGVFAALSLLWCKSTAVIFIYLFIFPESHGLKHITVLVICPSSFLQYLPFTA